MKLRLLLALAVIIVAAFASGVIVMVAKITAGNTTDTNHETGKSVVVGLTR